MFFERYEELCYEQGESVSAAANACGFSNAAVTKWRNGDTPRATTLRKLAQHFDVSMEYMTGESNIRGSYRNITSPEKQAEIEEAAEAVGAEELMDIFDKLRQRPEMRLLFHSVRNASPEQIKAIADMVDGFKK